MNISIMAWEAISTVEGFVLSGEIEWRALAGQKENI